MVLLLGSLLSVSAMGILALSGVICPFGLWMLLRALLCFCFSLVLPLIGVYLFEFILARIQNDSCVGGFVYFINWGKFPAIIILNVLLHFLHSFLSGVLIGGGLNCLILFSLLFIIVKKNTSLSNVLQIVNSFSSCI